MLNMIATRVRGGGFYARPNRAPGVTNHVSWLAPTGTVFAYSNLWGIYLATGTANFINLKTPSAPPGIATAPTAGEWSLLGPTVRFTAASSQSLTWTAPTAVPNAVTAATILRLASLPASGTRGIFGISTSPVINISVNTTGTVRLTYGGSTVPASTWTLPTDGTPFLVVASGNATTQNFLGVNLHTGNIFTNQTTTAVTLAAGGGTGTIGKSALAASVYDGDIAACLWSNCFLSLGDMEFWAQDSWLPWYPRPPILDLMADLLQPQIMM